MLNLGTPQIAHVRLTRCTPLFAPPASAYVANKSNQTIFVMILWLIPAVAGTVVLAAVEVTPKNAPGMLIAFYAVQVRP